MEQRPTQLVREHFRRRYLEPAARARRTGFEVVAGDVHKALGFHNRVPLVCQALTNRKFLEESGLILERTDGPPSGLGTRARFFYRWLNRAAAETNARSDSGFMRLRGLAKDVFRELGGGEKFLSSERAALAGRRAKS